MCKSYAFLTCIILLLTGCQPSQLGKNEWGIDTQLSSDSQSIDVKKDNASAINKATPEILRYKVATQTCCLSASYK